MKKDFENKSINPDEIRIEKKQQFFFPGSAEFAPMMVEARSEPEALEIWKESRIKAEKQQKLPEDKKTDGKNNIN